MTTARRSDTRMWTLCALFAFTHSGLGQAAGADAAIPLGLPVLQQEPRNDGDQDLVRLGERLFLDTRLSADGQVSCATCHVPQQHFSDREPRAKGHAGMAGTRNAPSLLNVAYATSLFWDGRAADLSSQAPLPFTNPVEHALPSQDALMEILRSDPEYLSGFARSFKAQGATIRMDMVADAIAAYERTLLAGNSPFDRYFYGNDSTAMSAPAIRGFELFRGRANCVSCHTIGQESSLLTDFEFHMAARGLPRSTSDNLAVLARRVVAAKETVGQHGLERLIATDPDIAALGRFVLTLDPADIGKFKTPSLRNVAVTAPYMHDGRVQTLQEAVELELYSRGPVAYPIILTRSEKGELMEFLKALSSPVEYAGH